MELVKSNVHMSRIKDNKMIQITLDDDFIVQDVKPDIDRIVGNKTWITIDSVKLLDGKVLVKGKLTYKILYVSLESVAVSCMEGNIPFDEVINVEGIEENDVINVDYALEDVSISIINSRKINVRAIVTFMASAEDIYDEDAIIDISGNEDTDYIKRPLQVMKMIVSKKDVFRVKEETEVPMGKPNIGKLIWSNMDARNVQTKLQEEKINVSGELLMFIMYEPEEEHMPLQWFEKTIPFNGSLDVAGVSSDMIPNIDLKLVNTQPEIYKDYDGENRLIRTDASLDMDIKVYNEEKIEIITDIYSPYVNYKIQEKQGCFENLLTKNQSKYKLAERIRMEIDENHILQICNVSGNVKIDDTIVVQNGINISGILEVNIVYASSNDKQPIGNETVIIPFEHNIEVMGIDENSKYYIKTYLEQLTADMVSSDEIEIRASIMLDTLVVNPIYENVIVDIKEEPLDMDIIKNMPGMVVHIVEEGDTLWNIAKSFYTTVDNIKKINNLQSDLIYPGDKLLVVKQVAFGGAI
ncbi:MAG: DUF3794 domain-containing protein [Lachnospiraceae bacterium]|nr:DUF3794 domain-containing protein [Lachnospiraceae bacterium]MBQ4069266.1 DUF3794 domain-containing protein [Lachnospiraceae bacterium]